MKSGRASFEISNLIDNEMNITFSDLDDVVARNNDFQSESWKHLLSLSEETQLDSSICDSKHVQTIVTDARRTWMKAKPLDCILDGKPLSDKFHGKFSIKNGSCSAANSIVSNTLSQFKNDANMLYDLNGNTNSEKKYDYGKITENSKFAIYRQVTSYTNFLYNNEVKRNKEMKNRNIVKANSNNNNTQSNFEQLALQCLYSNEFDEDDNDKSKHKKKKRKKDKKKRKHKEIEEKEESENEVATKKQPMPAIVVYPGMDRMVNDIDRAALVKVGAISEDVRTIKVEKKHDEIVDIAQSVCENAYDEFTKELELITVETAKSSLKKEEKNTNDSTVVRKQTKQIVSPIELPIDDGSLHSIFSSQLEYFALQLEAALIDYWNEVEANRTPFFLTENFKIRESRAMNELLSKTIETLYGNRKKKLRGKNLHHVAAIDGIDMSTKKFTNMMFSELNNLFENCCEKRNNISNSFVPTSKPNKNMDTLLPDSGFLPKHIKLPKLSSSSKPKRVFDFEERQRDIVSLLNYAVAKEDVFLRKICLNAKDFKSRCVEPGICLSWALTMAIQSSQTVSQTFSDDNTKSPVMQDKQFGESFNNSAFNDNDKTKAINLKLNTKNSLAAAFRQAIEAKKRASLEQKELKRKLVLPDSSKPVSKKAMFIPPGQISLRNNNAKTNITVNSRYSQFCKELDFVLMEKINTNLLMEERSEYLLSPKIFGFSTTAYEIFKIIPKWHENDPFSTKFRKAKMEEVIENNTEKDLPRVDKNSTNENISYNTDNQINIKNNESAKIENDDSNKVENDESNEVENDNSNTVKNIESNKINIKFEIDNEKKTPNSELLEVNNDVPPPPPTDLPKVNNKQLTVPVLSKNDAGSILDDVPLPPVPTPPIPIPPVKLPKIDITPESMLKLQQQSKEWIEKRKMENAHPISPFPPHVNQHLPLIPPPNVNGNYNLRPPHLYGPPPNMYPPPENFVHNKISFPRPIVREKTGQFRNLKVYVWGSDPLSKTIRKYLLNNDGEEIDPLQVNCLKGVEQRKKEILIFLHKNKLKKLYLLPNIGALRKVPSVHFLVYETLMDINGEKCSEVMMKGGLLIPDDKTLLQTHPSTLEILADFMVKQRVKNNNWKLLIHQFIFTTIKLMISNMPKQDGKAQRLYHIESILKHFATLDVVKILDSHTCDTHPKPPCELLDCIIKLQTSQDFYENHRHIILLSDIEISNRSMCCFSEMGIGVMSMEKFVSGVIGKKPLNSSKIVDPDFGLRISNFFVDAPISNATDTLRLHF